MMAAMLIVMVVFLAFGMHHGLGGTHEAAAPAHDTTYIQKSDAPHAEADRPASKSEKEGQ